MRELKPYASYDDMGLLLSLKHDSPSPMKGRHILDECEVEGVLCHSFGSKPTSEVYKVDS